LPIFLTTYFALLKIHHNKKGVKMKRIFLSVIFMTIFASFLGNLYAISEDGQNTQITKYYENMINETISKCHSKAQLKESKSVHLQSCAALKLKKANFLTKNKKMLIKEMVKRDIDTKQYKIEYFLNKKFFEYSNMAKSGTIKGNTL
jgi:hypothetical protein